MQATAEVARRPAVTIVAHDVGPVGGMERQLSELVRGLLSRGVEVTVVSRTCELEAHPGLRWVRVPGPSRPFVLAYPWFFAAGTLLVRRHRRGAVHTTGAIVLNRADVCTVHFCHRGPARGLARTRRRTLAYRLNAALAGPLSRLAERLVYRPSRVAALVAVSQGLADELRATVGGDAAVDVIPNGVDTTRFRPDPEARSAVRRELGLDDGDLLALFVGNEWRAKGLAVAVDAVARTEGWRLAVVGDGDREAYARNGRVTFLGERTDVERVYSAADALVAPSAYETFSLVAHEAAASGLPIVGTAVHGVAELLADGGGVLVPREAGAVAGALELLSDPGRRARTAAAARAAAEGHGWDAAVDAYLALYETARPAGRRSRHATSPAAA